MVVDIGGPAGKATFMNGTLIIFAGLTFLGILFTLMLPETKGRSLEEICGELPVEFQVDQTASIVTV